MFTALFTLVHRAVFYARLLEADKHSADRLRGAPCPKCGKGVLHRDNYKRSPRGHPPEFELCEGWDVRRSYTCSVCDHRVTPPSRLFLGRKVYLAPVVLAVAMTDGGADVADMKWLNETYALARHTVARWRGWWRDVLPATRCWKALRGRLRRPVDTGSLPDSLVARFGRTLDGVFNLLEALLPPVRTASCPAAEGLAM